MHHLGVLVRLLQHHPVLLHLLALDMRLLLIGHRNEPNGLTLSTGHGIPHFAHLRSLLLAAEVQLRVAVGLRGHLASNMHAPSISTLLMHVVAVVLER